MLAHETSPGERGAHDQGAAPPAARSDELAVFRRQLLIWTVRAWLEGMPDEYDTPISVVMPTSHRAPFLHQAITSVLAQRHRKFGLLVIDDGGEESRSRHRHFTHRDLPRRRSLWSDSHGQ